MWVRLPEFWLELEDRLANPIVTRVLRSPLHGLLSRRLLLLGYEGRRSGQYYETPVLYRETDDGIVVLTPTTHTTWWRNFEDGHPASVLLRGRWRDGVGTVVTDADAVTTQLCWLFGSIRRLTQRLVGRALPETNRLRRLGTDLVLVRIRLEGRETTG